MNHPDLKDTPYISKTSLSIQFAEEKIFVIEGTIFLSSIFVFIIIRKCKAFYLKISFLESEQIYEL